MALYDGDYKPAVKQVPTSEAVVQTVANDRNGIGYSGIGYKTPGVRTVSLSISAGTTCYDTSANAAYARQYPLARYLYIYVNKKPNEPLDPLCCEFIKFILSKDGQMAAEDGGFYSITNAVREDDLKRLVPIHSALKEYASLLTHGANLRCKNETASVALPFRAVTLLEFRQPGQQISK